MSREKTDSDGINLRRHLLQGAAGSLFFRAGNTLLTLCMAVVLARVLGVEGFGVYAFCLSLVQLLTIPAMLGGQQLLIREISAYKARGEYNLLRGLLGRIYQLSFLSSGTLVLAGLGFGLWIFPDSDILIPFLLALILIPLQAFLRLLGASLRGLQRILLGQAAQFFRPALVMLLVGLMFWISDQTLGPESAILAQVISAGVLVTAVFIFLRLVLPGQIKQARPEYETTGWLKSMWPFMLVAGLQVVNKEISIVLLGFLQDAEAVGFFRVAQRGAELVLFGLMAVNMTIAPTVSELYSRGEVKRLQRIISKSVLAVLAFALPMALILTIGGSWLIPWIFGRAYAPAYIPLVVLCLGQLVNAGMGSVAVILNMIGLERYTVRGMSISALSSIIFNLILIPFFGAIGAAIATSLSLIIWNTLLFVWLYRKTGLISTLKW